MPVRNPYRQEGGPAITNATSTVQPQLRQCHANCQPAASATRSSRFSGTTPTDEQLSQLMARCLRVDLMSEIVPVPVPVQPVPPVPASGGRSAGPAAREVALGLDSGRMSTWGWGGSHHACGMDAGAPPVTFPRLTFQVGIVGEQNNDTVNHAASASGWMTMPPGTCMPKYVNRSVLVPRLCTNTWRCITPTCPNNPGVWRSMHVHRLSKVLLCDGASEAKHLNYQLLRS